MGGKSQTISNSEPRLGNLRVQTSMYGLTIPYVRGRQRVGGNLVWFNGFKAVANTTTTQQGGKGGGGVTQQNTTFTYFADVIFALAGNLLNNIPTAWRGKKRFDGVTVSGQIATLRHEAVVPAGGVVAVPLSGNTFLTEGQVIYRDIISYTTGDADSQTWGDLQAKSGVDFTRSGATYTFIASFVGKTVTIEYQTQSSSSWTSALAQLGLELATGAVGQPVWPYMQTTYPGEALAHSGMAYVRGVQYPLTGNAEVENHNFEVDAGLQVGSGVLDCDVSDIIKDVLLSPECGVNWRGSRLGALTSFRNQCRANQLWMSPYWSDQQSARDRLQEIVRLANGWWINSGGKLDVVPLGDEAVSSAFGTFTPNTTPVFDLVFGEGGDVLAPIEVDPTANQDLYNIVTVEYSNRANAYNIESVDSKDAAHIELFGPKRRKDTIKAHDICLTDVAQRVADLERQRGLAIRKRYTVKLPFTRSLIDLGDLVTLTDLNNGLDRVPARVRAWKELDDAGGIELTCEDAPIGMASSPLYGAQAGSGYRPDYNAVAPSVVAPVFFETPAEWGTTGLGVAVAVTGPNSPNWGGCDVWVSLDGLNYRKFATLVGGSRYGTLSAGLAAAPGGSLAVTLAGRGGQLLGGSATDAAQLTTLCWVGGAQGGEFLAYQTSTLTGANAYTLSGLVRGAYGSNSAAKSSGASFVRMDDKQIATLLDLETSYIGKTLRFKFTSFNPFGAGQQSLADVTEYTYTVNGLIFTLPPPPPTSYTVATMPDGTREHTVVMPAVLPRDYKGVRFAYNDGATAVPWASQFLVTAELFPVGPDQGGQTIKFYTPAPGAGQKSFRVRGVDQFGNQSANEAVVNGVILGAPPASYRNARNYIKNGSLELGPVGSEPVKNFFAQSGAAEVGGSAANNGFFHVTVAPQNATHGRNYGRLQIQSNTGAGSVFLAQRLQKDSGNNLAPSRDYLFSWYGGGNLNGTNEQLAMLIRCWNAANSSFTDATLTINGGAGYSYASNRHRVAFTTPADLGQVEVFFRVTTNRVVPSQMFYDFDILQLEEIPAGVALADARESEYQDAIPGSADVDTPQIVPNAAADPSTSTPVDVTNSGSWVHTGTRFRDDSIASIVFANTSGETRKVLVTYYALHNASATDNFGAPSGGSVVRPYVKTTGTSYGAQPDEFFEVVRANGLNVTVAAEKPHAGSFLVTVLAGETLTVDYRVYQGTKTNANGQSGSTTCTSKGIVLTTTVFKR